MKISKGQTVSLTKAAADAGATAPLTKVTVGASWDAAVEGKEADMDLASIYLDENGKALADANGNGTNADEAVTAFFQLKNTGSEHTGDNLTGAGDGDDEQIKFELPAVPAEAKEIVILVTSFSGQNFGSVKNVAARVLNTDGEVELVSTDLTDDYGDATAVEVARLVRNGETWDVKATNEVKPGSVVEVFQSYGVTGIEV